MFFHSGFFAFVAGPGLGVGTEIAIVSSNDWHGARDRSGHSACDGACANAWPPYVVRSRPSSAGPGRRTGAIRRGDGRLQVTYNGHPLYYYAGDQKPGDTTGQGLNQFGAPWDVLSTSGTGIDTD